jgi:hypothetical protein
MLDGKPLPGASITLNGLQGSVAGVGGSFDFICQSVDINRDTISFSFVGYATKRFAAKDLLAVKTISLEPLFSKMKEVVVRSRAKSFFERSLIRKNRLLPADSTVVLYKETTIDTVDDSLFYYRTDGFKKVLFNNSATEFKQTHALLVRTDSAWINNKLGTKKRDMDTIWYSYFGGAFSHINDFIINRSDFAWFAKRFNFEKEYVVENQMGYHIVAIAQMKTNADYKIQFCIDTNSLTFVKINLNTNRVRRGWPKGDIVRSSCETWLKLNNGYYVATQSRGVSELAIRRNGKSYGQKMVFKIDIVDSPLLLVELERLFGNAVVLANSIEGKYFDKVANKDLPRVVSKEQLKAVLDKSTL